MFNSNLDKHAATAIKNGKWEMAVDIQRIALWRDIRRVLNLIAVFLMIVLAVVIVGAVEDVATEVQGWF